MVDEPIVKAAEIEVECRRLGYTLGWRFANCPWANASRAKLLLVLLNPGGHVVDGPYWSQELGSAYRVEEWKGCKPGRETLQRQVLALFDYLKLRDDEVFSAYYVPFRSPSWQALDCRNDALAYADSLWRWLIPQVAFERIVCIGQLSGEAMKRLTGATPDGEYKVDWGDVSARRYRMPDGRPIIALPHLSRFQLFGRPKSEDTLAELFEHRSP